MVIVLSFLMTIHGLEKQLIYPGTPPATCFHTPSSSPSLTQLWLTDKHSGSCTIPPGSLSFTLTHPDSLFSADSSRLAFQRTDHMFKWHGQTNMQHLNIKISPANWKICKSLGLLYNWLQLIHSTISYHMHKNLLVHSWACLVSVLNCRVLMDRDHELDKTYFIV